MPGTKVVKTKPLEATGKPAERPKPVKIKAANGAESEPKAPAVRKGRASSCPRCPPRDRCERAAASGAQVPASKARCDRRARSSSAAPKPTAHWPRANPDRRRATGPWKHAADNQKCRDTSARPGQREQRGVRAEAKYASQRSSTPGVARWLPCQRCVCVHPQTSADVASSSVKHAVVTRGCLNSEVVFKSTWLGLKRLNTLFSAVGKIVSLKGKFLFGSHFSYFVFSSYCDLCDKIVTRRDPSGARRRKIGPGLLGLETSPFSHKAFTVIPPNPKRRREIQRQAEAELAALEELRLSRAMAYVSISPSSVGGCMSLEEVRLKQQQEMMQAERKQKPG
ncbi:uncharacterized protein zgc:194621 [Xiphias gladius]|uniref:uncharacterized protein zgc:194621 n=1 Tax=Xiphias gladius TaxID=8245 RepID=UPI001A9942CB|nr:uncharacterized protein zgc:194621 [Xiphias gladius]